MLTHETVTTILRPRQPDSETSFAFLDVNLSISDNSINYLYGCSL